MTPKLVQLALVLSVSPKLNMPPSTSMARNLAGKTVLITGASSGIGRSTAFEFARTSPQDLKLVLTARRIERLDEIAEQIRNEVGGNVKICVKQLDVSEPKAVDGLVASLPREFQEIDVLVNNAYGLPILVLGLLDSRSAQGLHVRRRPCP